jgi:hypothetical protein
MGVLPTSSSRVSRAPSLSLRSLSFASARSSAQTPSPPSSPHTELPPKSSRAATASSGGAAPSGSLSAASSTLTLSLPPTSDRDSSSSDAPRWSAWSACSAESDAPASPSHATPDEVQICIPDSDSATRAWGRSSPARRKAVIGTWTGGSEAHAPVRSERGGAEGLAGGESCAGASTARGLPLRHASSLSSKPPPPSMPPPPNASAMGAGSERLSV